MRPATAGGAREALDELRRAAAAGEPYPLVLLDARMPETDAFDLAARIRATPDLAGAVVMMLESSDRQESLARCRATGISSYLMKPLKQSELLNVILTVVSTSGVPASDTGNGARTGEPARGTRPLRVLLAEDNLVNQKLAVRILEKRGHSVVVASNGKEAVEALEREPFDLVLMDVQMPDMGGFEATFLIRAREQGTGQRVPIIALTAHAMKGDRERCLEAGMDGYVAKPIVPQELFQAIEEVLPAQDLPEWRKGTEPVSNASSEAFDRALALERVGGDAQLLGELAGVFLEQAPLWLADVRDAVAAGDASKLKRSAHTLKGAVSTFEAREAFEAARRLEVMGHEGNLGDAGPACQALEEALTRLRPALLPLCGEIRNPKSEIRNKS
jgi:CheY-like chemotaxis protein/HPt (histidine-containing phosphotransfer) domain-containing protein